MNRFLRYGCLASVSSRTVRNSASTKGKRNRAGYRPSFLTARSKCPFDRIARSYICVRATLFLACVHLNKIEHRERVALRSGAVRCRRQRASQPSMRICASVAKRLLLLTFVYAWHAVDAFLPRLVSSQMFSFVICVARPSIPVRRRASSRALLVCRAGCKAVVYGASFLVCAALSHLRGIAVSGRDSAVCMGRVHSRHFGYWPSMPRHFE